MTDIEMSSDVNVELIDSMASDKAVVRASQVYTTLKDDMEVNEADLIDFLFANNMYAPLEHSVFTFYIEAPLLMFYEWRNRNVSSFNEKIGPNAHILPKFYTPADDRNLVATGQYPHEGMDQTRKYQKDGLRTNDNYVSQMAWDAYEERIALGVSRNVARVILPTNVYAEVYWTVNALDLIRLFKLRDVSWEMALGANEFEKYFREKMPLTYQAWRRNS